MGSNCLVVNMASVVVVVVVGEVELGGAFAIMN